LYFLYKFERIFFLADTLYKSYCKMLEIIIYCNGGKNHKNRNPQYLKYPNKHSLKTVIQYLYQTQMIFGTTN